MPLKDQYPEIQAVLDGESEGCIVQGDCLDVMKLMPDDCVDAVVTDPNYGIGADAAQHQRGGRQDGAALSPSRDYGDTNWDAAPPPSDAFVEMQRVGQEQVIFGGNYFTDYLPASSSWIVWDKDNGSNGYADVELAWTSHKRAARKVKWRWHGMLQEDMKNKDARVHPTQKPVGLMVWVVENYTARNAIILDPYCGSGTTCVAAKKLGRRWIGIELDENYCRIARNRVQNTERPLFTETD